MKTSLLVQTLCFLGAVFLCGAQTSIEPVNATSPITPTINATGVFNTSMTTLPTASTENSTSTLNTTSTDQPVVEGTGGLSPGAIAGIVIGTIAGVAVLGGGIFGILKYTGKI